MTDEVLITGCHGTVAPVLVEYFREQGIAAVAWDRQQVDPTVAESCTQFVEQHDFSAVFHLAMGSPQWAQWLAQWTSAHHIPLIYASSTAVYSGRQGRVLTPDMAPDAVTEYGQYKLSCERHIIDFPEVRIARLGWQIAPTEQGNTMTRHFSHQQHKLGYVPASEHWFPSCSMVDDTAVALAQLVNAAPGVYHFDANPGFSLYALAVLLNRRYQFGWQVRLDNDIHYENRMSDSRIQLPSLAQRLNQ